MTPMLTRLRGWWQLGVTVIVTWTIVVLAYGWLNLPRAQNMPHQPQYLSKFSNEASSILSGGDAKAKPASGEMVWSDEPRLARMSNGERLAFPAATSGERISFVSAEYFQMLAAEAGARSGPYLLGMLAIWLAPAILLLLVGLAAKPICRGYKYSLSSLIRGGYSLFSSGRAVAAAFAKYPALRAPANRESHGSGRQLSA